MNDSQSDLSPRGALLECCISFPQFKDDIDVLVREGYLKVTSSESCEWVKSKTSLAEYFKWADGDADWVPGGYWAPIEKAFGIKRHSLRKLAGSNGNPCKPDESRDFKKIKLILQKCHELERATYNLLRVYRYIKFLILEAENENPETVLVTIQKISSLFIKNVDKNGQSRK